MTTHKQILTSCHAHLIRRELYDRTGSLQDSEELAGEQSEELYNYYRGIYKKVGCCRAVWLCMPSPARKPARSADRAAAGVRSWQPVSVEACGIAARPPCYGCCRHPGAPAGQQGWLRGGSACAADESTGCAACPADRPQRRCLQMQPMQALLTGGARGCTLEPLVTRCCR